MRIHPAFVPEVLEGETPTSYLSRLSSQIGSRARRVAEDIGTTLQKIVDGDPAALSVLTDSCGLPRNTFDAHALSLGHDGLFRLAGQEFPERHLSRSRLFACPQCIAEEGLHQKAQWQIAAIRVCLAHNCMLVPFQDRFRQQDAHDLVQLAQANLNGMKTIQADVPPDGSDSLAQYLTRRLNGHEHEGWLASMPAYAAARSCELVGWVRTSGVRAHWRQASALERHVAGSVGYAMLSSGGAPFLDLLRGLRQTAAATEFGFEVIYGSVFGFLKSCEAEPYRAMRTVLRNHLMETAAFGAGEIILGEAVPRRVLHSVRSIGKEFAIDQRVVQRRVATLGLIGEEAANLPGDRILIDAEVHADTIAKLPELLERSLAKRHLNAKRNLTSALHPSVIAPFCAGLTPDDDLFLRSELDRHFKAWTSGATEVDGDEAGFRSIAEAARRAASSPLEIFRLLAEGRLSQLRIDPRRVGVPAIMVNVSEVRETLISHPLRPHERQMQAISATAKGARV